MSGEEECTHVKGEEEDKENLASIEKKQKIEEVPEEFDIDYVSFYILYQILGIDRYEREDPLLGDLNVSRDNLKKSFQFIVDNYDALEKKVNAEFFPETVE